MKSYRAPRKFDLLHNRTKIKTSTFCCKLTYTTLIRIDSAVGAACVCKCATTRCHESQIESCRARLYVCINIIVRIICIMKIARGNANTLNITFHDSPSSQIRHGLLASNAGALNMCTYVHIAICSFSLHILHSHIIMHMKVELIINFRLISAGPIPNSAHSVVSRIPV